MTFAVHVTLERQVDDAVVVTAIDGVPVIESFDPRYKHPDVYVFVCPHCAETITQRLDTLTRFALQHRHDTQPRLVIELEPERVARLLEILESAGAHPSGLGSYGAAADALAFHEDIKNMVERQA